MSRIKLTAKSMLILALLSSFWGCKPRQTSVVLDESIGDKYDWYVRLAKDLSVGQHRLSRNDFYKLKNLDDRGVFNALYYTDHQYRFGLDYGAYLVSVIDESLRVNGYENEIQNRGSILYKNPQAITFAEQLTKKSKTDHFYAYRQPAWTPQNTNKSLDFTSLETQPALTPDGFLRSHTNSVSNLNRKRAAYFLKNYFCDDLTPISIEIFANPADANSNKHLKPACQSCHYKLDPLAGSLVDLDMLAGGRVYQVADRTLEGAELEAYLSNWQFRGYVASLNPEYSSKHSIAMENLEELFKKMPTIPAVQKCFAVKAVEYFLGSKQAYDQAWFEGIYKRLAQTWPHNFHEAFTNLVYEVVSSKAYKASQRNPNVCYDNVSDSNVEIPCSVRFHIQNNCIGCHDSQDELNMNTWVPYADGKQFFKTRWADRKVAITKFQEAISNSDPTKRMPLGMYIDDPTRNALFNWLSEESSK